MNALDISSNNHTGQLMNWQEVKGAGYQYVYVKATQGHSYVNPYLLMDVRDARNAGLEVGLYHFYDPAVSPEQNAAWFITNGINQFGQPNEPNPTMLPVVDIELPGITPVDRDRFCQLVKCGQYMDRSFYNEFGNGGIFTWLALGGSPIPTDNPDVWMVQTETKVVPGIPGVQCDIDEVLNTALVESVKPTMPTLAAPIVDGATTPGDLGYWLVGADGGVFCFGNAQFYGSLAGKPLSRPIVSIQATSTGLGYTLIAADGGTFTFGDAKNHGSVPGDGIGPA